MLNRPIAQTFGVLALAVALTTTSTAAYDAVSSPDRSLYSTKSKAKKAATLAGLSPQLRTVAVQ